MTDDVLDTPATDPAAYAISPSTEVLGEAARRIDSAYPGLYRHQHAGIAFLLARRRAILADDMGLGKTRQAVIAMREAAPEGPFLVICPAGVKLVWEREIRVIERDADVQVVDGARLPGAGHRWTVINYDLLARNNAALAAIPWAGLIVDEAHYIKNGSQRARQVLGLAGIESTASATSVDPVVYLLTGTPMTSRPRDLFNLLRVVRHPLGKSFYSYARRYCAAVSNGYGLDTRGASNLHELAEIVAGVMLRRTKDAALDLPPKTRTWQAIDLDSAATRRDERRALQFLADEPSREGPRWVQFLGQLNRARHTLAVAKAPATLEAVRDRVDAGEKVVVFSSYTAVIDRLAEALGASAVRITGETTAANRMAAADRFQTHPGVRVLLGNLHAAGVGLTLTAASHVVFNDLDWVPANHWQAEDRIYRIGQTKPAFVTYLVAEGTLDDYVAALLEQKSRNIGVLEAAAADRASVVEAVVDAAISGRRPDWTSVAVRQAEGIAARKDASSMGLLGDVLDLLAQAGRGLASVDGGPRTVEIASKSKPGESYAVTIDDGIATCPCAGFSYRGNCSHAREATRMVAA